MTIRSDTDELIAFLNAALELDPEWMAQLFRVRLPCNEAIVDHPTIQVRGGAGDSTAGLLGLLNGYLGTIDSGDRAGWGPLQAVYDRPIGETGVGKLLCFRRTAE